MAPSGFGNRLDRPVHERHDHLLGPADARITLVEYGSYDCPACREANKQISGIRDQLGDRMRYVFRHRPIPGSDIARRAAELVAGLVLGKPVGMFLASALAVRLGVAVKPEAYSWRQLAGAGALAGIGFTMSLFIAGRAFPVEADFAAAKIGIFAASVLSAVIGVALLWSAGRASAPVPSPPAKR